MQSLHIVNDRYPGPKLTTNGGLVVGSDGAGEVVDVGEDVREWRVGDKVVTVFHQDWESGEHPANLGAASLGSTYHGTLTKIGVYEESGLVRMLEHLSYEEASTLSCAALTAFTCLRDSEIAAGPDSVVVVQGMAG